MFIKQNSIRNKFRTLFLKLYNRIENNGNIFFNQNGERVFTEHLFQRFENQKNKRFVIFDVGANVGKYTQLLLEKSKQHHIEVEIHCFEPTQACFADLESQFKGRNNVNLVKKAVSDSEGTMQIYYNQERSGLASLYQRDLKAFHVDLNCSETIETLVLKEYIAQKNIQHIDFLKIDIEGHELKAFQGMGEYLHANFVDFIQFEYGGANLDSHTTLGDFYRLFTEKGFSIAKIMKKGLQIREYQPQMDNFNYSNYVAISNRLI